MIVGRWRARSADNPQAQWIEEAQTPATIDLKPQEFYQLRFDHSVVDDPSYESSVD
jgi:hypothetical protein